jgi:hypothetical protein
LPRIRREHDETDAPEPHTGIQGEGGVSRHKMKRTPIGDTAEYRLDKKPDGKLPSPPIVDPLEMSGTGADPALPVFLRGHPTADDCLDFKAVIP